MEGGGSRWVVAWFEITPGTLYFNSVIISFQRRLSENAFTFIINRINRIIDMAAIFNSKKKNLIMMFHL